MKVMIDTNIIISGALNPSGLTAKALYKALSAPYEPVVCDYIVDELHRKFSEKFPHRMMELEAFLFNALQFIRVLPTPEESDSSEVLIRDVKDRPILRAALAHNIDYLLTGDKDFLEATVDVPCIVSAVTFLDLP
ncbi:MAG: putative toxin-antitoxin system toxin component, PIN family [Lachnospiraceae bacterium]|nr:putative toxin-antitoxin system toxin component, PIN family [Lachnospiraceae bacterium]